jgi:hypothetical protein
MALCDITDLRALGEAGSDDLSSSSAETIRGEIEARHRPIAREDIRDISLRYEEGIYGSLATYVHLGRKAAVILAP